MGVGIASALVERVRNDYNNLSGRSEADSPLDVLACLHCTVRSCYLRIFLWRVDLTANATRVLVPIVSLVALRLCLSLRQIFFTTSVITMTRSGGPERSEGLSLNLVRPKRNHIESSITFLDPPKSLSQPSEYESSSV